MSGVTGSRKVFLFFTIVGKTTIVLLQFTDFREWLVPEEYLFWQGGHLTSLSAWHS